MKMKTAGLVTAVIGLALGVGQANALNITIPDAKPGVGFAGGPFGAGGEDQEVESISTASQAWDLEAFVLQGQYLYLVGGYDLIAGEAYGSHVYTSGDLFIKVGGEIPTFEPVNYTVDVSNSLYGYTYAVDLSSIGLGTGGGSTDVFALTGSSILNTVTGWDGHRANPWKYENDQPGTSFSTGINYTTGFADNAPELQALGLGDLLGGSHNILRIDVGFLGTLPGNSPVYFSYTMECGNDSIKGRVPDGGASLLLIGLGLAALSAFGFKRQNA